MYNPNTQEEIFLAPFEYFASNIMIYDNYFILASGNYLYMLNLLNGEKKSICIYNESTIYDYIIINDIIYTPLGLSFNLKNYELYHYAFDYEKYGDAFGIVELFSDGSNIYSLASIGVNKNYHKLVAVTLDYIDGRAYISIKEIGE